MMQYVLFLFYLFITCKGIDTDKLKLKQVLILSRHNLRTPIVSDLQKYSPKYWPMQKQESGHLTRKGALLEGYMSEYFMKWFKREQLLQDGCPFEDQVYVFANSINRTIATAEAFVEAAFKDCNITVHHKNTLHEEMDPIFRPVINNTTLEYKNMAINEMNKKLNSTKLKEAYSVLNKILDIKDAEICKSESICDLTDASKNNISYEVGREPGVFGPLYIANSVLDSFVMNFYDGVPLEDIAWGQLTTSNDWKVITEIGRTDQNVRYSTLAKDIGKPLLNYLTKIFLNFDNMPKLMLIVGHDYNQNTVFHAMDFKSITLPNHYERFPIGGKIVFQRWTDNKNDYLKVEYIYATWTQIRNGIKFSTDNQPQRLLLELKWCEVDTSGFCSWKEFINKLSSRQ